MSFSFGEKFKITVFGESHGKCVGVVVEGCPPGIKIDETAIQKELDRRKPGNSDLVSQRKEDDKLEVISGVYNGKSTGTSIAMIIRNEDFDSKNYIDMKDTPRPGHADLTASIKYEGHNDIRGGGIFSGRITAAFVMAGAIAKEILLKDGIKTEALLKQVGNAKTEKDIEAIILKAKKEGDSTGGIIECTITGISQGVGEPIFDSIESCISHAIFSIPGVKGIEFGSGFKSIVMKGSEHNDEFIVKNGKVVTKTNNAGGILGGISNGMPIVFRVAMKPTSSIIKVQKSVNMKTMKQSELKINGRYDPCIAVRGVPAVEGIAAVAILDLMMRWKR